MGCWSSCCLRKCYDDRPARQERTHHCHVDGVVQTSAGMSGWHLSPLLVTLLATNNELLVKTFQNTLQGMHLPVLI